MKRTWFRELLRRRIVVILLLVLQALFIAYVVSSDSRMAEGVRILLRVLSVVIVLHVIAHKDKGANKVAWVFLTLLFPCSAEHFTSSITSNPQQSASARQLPKLNRKAGNSIICLGMLMSRRDKPFRNTFRRSVIYRNLPVFQFSMLQMPITFHLVSNLWSLFWLK